MLEDPIAYLRSLTPGPTVALGRLTLLPLRGPATGPEVALLDGATGRVDELPGGGRVGQVRVKNLGARPLLLLAGEILRGALQNRIVNASTLVAAGQEHILAVSCVERGRWAYRQGQGFEHSEATAPWELRSRAHARTSDSKLRTGQSVGDQTAVWRDVDRYLDAHCLWSPTSDLDGAVAARDMDEEADAWQPSPNDVGAAFFIGGRFVGLEVLGRPSSWRAGFSRILRGVRVASTHDGGPPAGPEALLHRTLAEASYLRLSSARGDALGEELHGEAEGLHLAALLVDGEPVHVRLATLDDALESPPTRRHSRPGMPLPWVEPSTEPLSLQALLREVRANPSVVVDRAFVVAPTSTYLRLARGSRDAPPAPGLPHRAGGGLVAWICDSDGSLAVAVDALRVLGISRFALYARSAAAGARWTVPDWLEAGPAGEGALALALRPRELP